MTQPVISRINVIHYQQVRNVLGKDVVAGDVLPAGVVLFAEQDQGTLEHRLQLPGSNILYVDGHQTVGVLARVDAELLAELQRKMA